MIENAVFLDPDVAILVRGGTDFQKCEDVPRETAEQIADAYALIASELYSLGEVRMIIYIYIYIYVSATVPRGTKWSALRSSRVLCSLYSALGIIVLCARRSRGLLRMPDTPASSAAVLVRTGASAP